MRRGHRLRGASIVVAVLAISACLTLKLTQIPDAIAVMGGNVSSQEYDFGTQSTPVSTMFTFFPVDMLDDYTLLGVTQISPAGTCDQFSLQGPGPATNTGKAHVYFSTTGTCDAIQPNSAGSFGSAGMACDYQFMATFTPSQPGSVQCQYAFTYMDTGAGSSAQYTITLDGTGNVSGITATSQLTFTGVPVGTTSGPAYSIVQNNGSSGITVTSMLGGIGSANFTYAPTGSVPLGGNGSASYSVKCIAGATPSTYNAVLQFTSSAGSAATTMLTCTSVDTGGLGFGGTSPINFPLTIVKGTAMPDQQLVASYGGSPMPIMFVIDTNAAGNGVTPVGAGWSGNTYSGMIGSGSGASPSITLTFHWVPTKMTPGPLGLVNVMFGATPIPVTINGDAEIASVAANPLSIDFGPVCAGNPATPQAVDIYNSGGADVTLTNITLTQTGSQFTFSPQPTNAPLLHAHGNDVMTSVALTAITAGDLMATLKIHLNDPDTTKDELDIPIHAKAIDASSGVSATPNMLSFPTIAVGSTSPPQQFVLTNCGTTPLTIVDHPITDKTTNMPSTDFAITDPPDPLAPIPPAGSMTFTIAMSPTTSGVKMAQLSLVHMDGTSTPVDLIGTGYVDTGSGGGGKKNRQTYYACDAGRPEGLAPIALALLALRRRRK